MYVSTKGDGIFLKMLSDRVTVGDIFHSNTIIDININKILIIWRQFYSWDPVWGKLHKRGAGVLEKR